MAKPRLAPDAFVNHFTGSSRQLDDRQRQSLLDDARAGSTESHAALLNSYWPVMSRYFGRRLSRKLAAKVSDFDLTQSACLLAWGAFEKFKGCLLINYRGWLMQICHRLLNAVLRQFEPGGNRDLAREQPLDELAFDAESWRAWNREQPSAEQRAAALETATQVQAAIAGLPADELQIFTLHHDDKLTFAEIARRLALSGDSVERAYKRTLAQLKRRLAG